MAEFWLTVLAVIVGTIVVEALKKIGPAVAIVKSAYEIYRADKESDEPQVDIFASAEEQGLVPGVHVEYKPNFIERSLPNRKKKNAE